MRNKNLYKVRKNTIKDKSTNVVLNIYYSIVRRERYFFDTIGPYVWKEYSSSPSVAFVTERKKHHYSNLNDATMLKDRLNANLLKEEINTYNESVILE